MGSPEICPWPASKYDLETNKSNRERALFQKRLDYLAVAEIIRELLQVQGFWDESGFSLRGNTPKN